MAAGAMAAAVTGPVVAEVSTLRMAVKEIETHPNIPYKPFGAGSYEAIPPAYRQQLPRRFTAERM
jgi:hypothetical protein